MALCSGDQACAWKGGEGKQGYGFVVYMLVKNTKGSIGCHPKIYLLGRGIIEPIIFKAQETREKSLKTKQKLPFLE